VRRLLEEAIQREERVDGAELIRYDRWSYRWSEVSR